MDDDDGRQTLLQEETKERSTRHITGTRDMIEVEDSQGNIWQQQQQPISNEKEETHLPIPQHNIPTIDLPPLPTRRITVALEREFPQRLIVFCFFFFAVTIGDRFTNADCRGDGGDGKEAEHHVCVSKLARCRIKTG